MAPPLLTLRGAAVNLADRVLFANVDLSIERGDRLCLVGRNGTGKSTLLKLLAAAIEPDEGERFLQPGCRVAYLSQEPDLSGFATIEAYVAEEAPEGEEHRAAFLLHAVELDGGRAPEGLSGGEMRRAALARALVSDPDVLLLDEPTNHLDIRAIEWLEQELSGLRAAIVMVSHDRMILRRLARATLWLERGRLRRMDKGFDAFEDWSVQVLEQEAQERHKLNRLIAEETRWSHEGISARRRRNQGRMRRLQDLRAQRAAEIRPTGAARLMAATGEVSGKLVIEAKSVSKSYGERTIISNFSVRIMRGDKVGIIGPNGAGKTTLLRLLTGSLAPDSGSMRLGSNLVPVYLDQGRSLLAGDPTVQSVLCERGGDQVIVRGEARHVASYLESFLFDPKSARAPVSALSGGERNRLLLAWAFTQEANLLVLDEPTNDLDMETLDLLQELLADYYGTVLLVSHDRDFLDRVVTSTIALEGDGTATEYAGGYSDYLLQRRQAVADDAAVEASRTAARPKPSPEKSRATKKLSYKDQRRLDALPGDMEKLQQEMAALEQTLSDSGLFSREPETYARAAARLEAARDELARAEDEWLELEALRESLASAD